MSEMILLRCPICSRELVAVADVPAIRQLAVRCPACIDLAVTVMLERNQPRNPYTNEVPEDPDGWRVQSVIAGQARQPEPAHRRQSRRQARRRHKRH